MKAAKPQLIELEYIICDAADITRDDLLSKNRKKQLVDARHMIWYIARHYIGLSYSEIADFHDRDHTTVIHGVRRMKGINAKDEIISKIRKKNPEILKPCRKKNLSMEDWNI